MTTACIYPQRTIIQTLFDNKNASKIAFELEEVHVLSFRYVNSNIKAQRNAVVADYMNICDSLINLLKKYETKIKTLEKLQK